MPFAVFADGLLDKISLGLDWAALRQRAIANNLANVDTPGYKREDVSFPEVLRQAEESEAPYLALAVTAPGHLVSDAQPTLMVYRDASTSYRNDGNNVDIDVETAELAKNALYYNALINQAALYLANLRLVISEGRR